MKGRRLTPAELEELFDRMQEEELKAYIESHPRASPEEILAHVGVTFDPEIWNASLEEMPDVQRKLATLSNPEERKKWGFRHDG